ncbi:MAG: hypothetical protein COA71_11605 [SAR86 cluster bacterium]|uniref:Cupin 2 conserved barrel domain-containing protein n=1 Tax=SAR86 cluster bacterium TaxID=2030880 RepID=A0A2A5C9J6_9GAMM|nr:MAG: hypothetical protein COA71_11605 [SAR86 cluster bacterium]
MLVAGLILILLCSAFAMNATAQQNAFAGEKIVHVLEEPRHRPVMQEDQFTVFDMQLRPGDASLPHIHNQAILLNRISNPEGPQYGIVEAITDYATETYTHKIENSGTYLWRIIGVIHDGNGEPLNPNDTPTGMTLEPEVEDNWFRAYRIELAPGESTLTQTHSNPTLIVQVTEGLMHVSREDGLTRELAQPADWAYRDVGSSFSITNVGDIPVAVAINEIRIQGAK